MSSEDSKGLHPASSFFCLNSSADAKVFPHNTPSVFSNKLPHPIVNKEGKKFFIRASAIAITRKIFKPLPVPSHLKIQLYELEGQRSGREFSHTLAGFTADGEIRNEPYLLHTFKDGPYLPIRFQQLDVLHVTITNDNDQIVHFADGFPTLLWLEMTTNPAEDDQFVIHNISHQPATHPNNKLGLFTCPLPTEMVLDDHEVAVSQVLFPPFLVETYDPVTLKINDEIFDYSMAELKTTVDLLKNVKRDVKECKFRHEMSAIILRSPQKDRGKLMFHRKELRGEHQERLVIVPSAAFTRACGQLTEPRGPTELKPGMAFKFEGQPSIYFAKPNPIAHLHCSAVKPGIVGSHHATLLQCVPVKYNKAHNAARLYEPPQLVFQPAQNTPFDSIQFSFRESNGAIKQFVPVSRSSFMMITLVFRRRKK